MPRLLAATTGGAATVAASIVLLLVLSVPIWAVPRGSDGLGQLIHGR